MDKNRIAMTPPMGWNSYDYYDTTVNEEQVKANADYMAKHLKEFGWEYVVVDIQWYAYGAGSQREKYQYIPFGRVEMDEYSRLLPCPERFPSSMNGQGFGPLADYIHSLGLKFGIHIMRGIPRVAAHNRTKVLGTSKTANEIADPNSICSWNPDMYGLDVTVEEAQTYYNSLFAMYAQWGVDFVKCDDICRHDMESAEKEIEMLYHAIQQCGREMVLSLSPGPAIVEKAQHYMKYANMWRITDDFWDAWPFLLNMFERCEKWQEYVSSGCYPDCDMLPVGYIGKGFGEERYTNFTKDEQITMLTLWCMFRSPLMLGCELTKLDPWTLQLLTNTNVLRLLSSSTNARQRARDDRMAIWTAQDTEEKAEYLAVFNLSDECTNIGVSTEWFGQNQFVPVAMEELWTGEHFDKDTLVNGMEFMPHSCKLFKYHR